ncbi:ester cyclase [Antrihabitans cavernicola]|nr:ester cyclase [Spelaeibacter cavernicola]
MSASASAHNERGPAGTLVMRLYDEALNGSDYATVVDEVVGSDVIVHELDGDRHGRDAVASTMRTLHSAFTQMHFDVHDLIEADDKVVVRWRMVGTHTGEFARFAATGKEIEQRAIVIYAVRDGVVVAVWPMIDRLGMARQLQAAGR